MPIIWVENLGATGVMTDPAPHDLPPEAWSGAQNVRFTELGVERIAGEVETLGTPQVVPYWLFPWKDATDQHWFYFSEAKAYITDSVGLVHTEVTPVAGDFISPTPPRWNGGVLGGVPIINNGVEAPFNYDEVSGKFVSLANWPASTIAAVIRPFRQFLVALDVTKSGNRYPTMVKWSHPADPGTVPPSWDEADATKLAGEFPLSETPGFLVDCEPLRGSLVIYKEDSTWIMQYAGGGFIFQTNNFLRSIGLLAQRCAKEFLGKHIILGQSDVFVHDGQTVTPIGQDRIRRRIFTTLDQTNYTKCFIVPNYALNEMWVCVPEGTYVTRAFIWNWRSGAWTERELPNTAHISWGALDPGAVPNIIDSRTGLIDTYSGLIDSPTFNPSILHLVMGDVRNTKLLLGDYTDQFNGNNFLAQVERSGLAIVGKDIRGNIRVDVSAVKFIRALYPKFTGSGSVSIQVGIQMEVGGLITWGAAQSFEIGVDRKVDVTISTRLIALRISSQENAQWALQAIGIDLDLVGMY